MQDFKESHIHLSLRLCKAKQDFDLRKIFDMLKKDENNLNASVSMPRSLYLEKVGKAKLCVINQMHFL